MVSKVVPLLATAIWGCGLWPSEGNYSCLKQQLFLSLPTLLSVTNRDFFLLKTLSFSMKLVLWQALILLFIRTQVCGSSFLYHPSQMCHTNSFLSYFLCLVNYLWFHSAFQHTVFYSLASSSKPGWSQAHTRFV